MEHTSFLVVFVDARKLSMPIILIRKRGKSSIFVLRIVKKIVLKLLCTPGGFEPILRKCPQIDKLILFVKKEHYFVFSKTDFDMGHLIKAVSIKLDS